MKESNMPAKNGDTFTDLVRETVRVRSCHFLRVVERYRARTQMPSSAAVDRNT